MTLLIVLAMRAGAAWGQAPMWAWANSPADGNGGSAAVDAAGNVYVAGTFSGVATFGTSTLTSSGQQDVYVAKLSPDGVYQWAVQVIGTGFEYRPGLALDASGSIYLTAGYTSQTLTLGTTVLPNLSTAGPGQTDLFVAKLSPTGVWRWAVRGGGLGADETTDVAVDGMGNVYVSGLFYSSTATFGTIAVTHTGGGNRANPFVGKLDSTGTWQWVTPAADGDGRATAIAVDANGSASITGYYHAGPLTFGATALPAPVGFEPDAFVAKLTPGGTWAWAHAIGNTREDRGFDIALDSAGNVLFSGCFRGQVAFGPTTLTGAGETDAFVAKLSAAGAWQWAAPAGGSGYEFGNGLGVDSDGAAYVAGSFTSQPMRFGALTLTAGGVGSVAEVFVAKLTPAGAWQWAAAASGHEAKSAFALAVAGPDQVVVTGYFVAGPVSFGSTVLINPGTNNRSFVARLGASTGVGLPEAAARGSLALVPNPAHHTVRLAGATTATAILLDVVGRTVRTWSVPASGELDLTGLAPGLYTVRAGTLARRLVVE